jgi:hypothetical protein
MILDRLDVTADELARATGWEIRPEGACKEEVCVLLPPLHEDAQGRFDVRLVTERLGMPIAHDEQHGVWALGPESGNRRVLDNARMPELVLADFEGDAFDVATLRGRKVVLMAWASW